MAEHMGYVIAAYAAALVTVFGLVAWVRLDLRAQRGALERLGKIREER